MDTEQREICPKTGKLCAAGCTDPVNGMKATGYCYEKERAGDYRNPTLVERERIVSYLRRKTAGLWGAGQNRAKYYDQIAGEIERGDHAQPESERREGQREQETRDELVTALRDLLHVIETDALIPESVSYMRQARAALAKARGGAA